jgi:hypothetical protein
MAVIFAYHFTHKKCVPAAPYALPTRLLDLKTVVQGKDIRLCSSTALMSETRYATLSHRWGTLPILKLTHKNVEGLQRGTSLYELSKAFQDAVAICRRYGLHYLWIDSLCIMQDEVQDWKIESLRMSSVYGLSTLNIATAGAADGGVGCFFSRYPLASRKCHTMVNHPGLSGVIFE